MHVDNLQGTYQFYWQPMLRAQFRKLQFTYMAMYVRMSHVVRNHMSRQRLLPVARGEAWVAAALAVSCAAGRGVTAVAGLALAAPAAVKGAGGSAALLFVRAGAAATLDGPAAAALCVVAAPPVHTNLLELLWQHASGPCRRAL